MKQYKSVSIIILILGIIYLLAQSLLERIDIFIRNDAIYKCGQIASVTYETDGGKAKTNEPFKPAYEQCLEDKNIIR